MTPGIRAPFFMLLLLASLKGFLALPSQENSVTSSQDTSSSLTSTTTPVHSGNSDPATSTPEERSTSTPVHSGDSDPISSPPGDSTSSPTHSSTSSPATTLPGDSTSPTVHSGDSDLVISPPVNSTSSPVHSSPLSPAMRPPGDSTNTGGSSSAPVTTSTSSPVVHSSTLPPATSPPGDSTSSPVVHSSTLPPATSPEGDSTSSPVVHFGTPLAPATGPPEDSTSGPPEDSTSTTVHSVDTDSATTPPGDSTSSPLVHTGTLSPATSPPLDSDSPPGDSTSSPVHHGTSATTNSSESDLATTPVYSSMPSSTTKATSGSADHSGTRPSVPSQHPISPTMAATSSNSTIASSSYISTVPFPTFSSNSSPQLSVGVSFFLLSFYIRNHPFNSSLEDPSSNYYQELKRNISGLFLQIFNQDFLGISTIKFRSGSVVVESTMIFREGTFSASEVKSQLIQHKKEADEYNLTISGVNVNEMQFPSSAQSWPGVPGWGVALLVLVCILVALALIYCIALAVCQCRRKSYGQLDLFPTQDTYHPMSEYPTYHTHGRYVPPGSTKRSPYEEVSAGNGSSSLSYTNPALATTSANL